MNLELTAVVDPENPIEGDLRLTTGQLTLVDGNDAVRQHIANRLRFFLGEWFLDLRQGLPFYQDVLVKNPDRESVRSIFRTTILRTPGVEAVDELQLTVSASRVLSVSFRARLEDGGAPLVFEDFILGDL